VPYCPYCGVEVDQDTSNCPLCGGNIPKEGPPPLLKGDYPRKEHQLYYKRRFFTSEERRTVLWFFSLLFSVPITIVLVVDLLRDWAISWSLFAIVGIIGIWVGIAVGLFIRKAWLLMLLYSGLILTVSLIINMLAGTINLFLAWNMPIILMAAVLITPCALYAKFTSRKGFNVAGMILWAIGLFCIGIDMLIGLNLESRQFLHGWSLIVAAALGPVGALLMYVHYRLGKTISFRRFFHA